MLFKNIKIFSCMCLLPGIALAVPFEPPGLIDNNWGAQIGTSTIYPAPIAKTGQTISYRYGDDGALQKGVTISPRFTDNYNGTITDNLTGLVWMKNANCSHKKITWNEALNYANELASGTCGLSDASKKGDWRLPNIKELQSIIDFSNFNPALPSDHPFLEVKSNWYWSSTMQPNNVNRAWLVFIYDGDIGSNFRINKNYIWPVRGG